MSRGDLRNARLGNGAGGDFSAPSTPLWYPLALGDPSPKRAPGGGPPAPAHGHMPPEPTRTPARGIHPAHDRFNTWLALRSQPAARPVQTNPSQSRLDLGHHLLTARHRLLCLSVRLSGRGQQRLDRLAHEPLSCPRNSSLRPCSRLSTTYPEPSHALRPRRVVLRQRLPTATPRP